MPDHLATVRRYITNEVFTSCEEVRIVPGGQWLMDFRRVCLDPAFLDAYTDSFYERYRGQYPFQVGGMEVAAIPLVAAIIMKMRERGLPVNGFFIRKSRKKTGLLKMVEGKLTDDPIILVDDLINHGYTLDRQLKVLAEADKKVMAFFTLLRFRPLAAYAKYAEAGIAIDSLFGLDDFTPSLGTKLFSDDAPVPQENFTVRWYFRAPEARLEAVHPKSGIAIDATHIYVGSDCGILYALKRADGSVAWQHKIGFGRFASRRDKEIFSTPLLLGGRLFFGAYDGNVYAVEARTGKRLWVSFEADWIHGAIAYSERRERLYVPTMFGARERGGGVAVLDPVTGRGVARLSIPSRLGAAPLTIDSLDRLILAGEDGRVYALDLGTGRILWTFQTAGAIKERPAYDAKSERVICSSFDGSVYVIRVADGMLAWRFEVGLANYSSPVIEGDRVFVASLDKQLYALDRETGKKLWSFPARARIFASPTVLANRLYIGANDARLYELDPATGRQTGFFQAVERITNPPVFDPATGDYFLTTYANEVYCLKRNESGSL